MPSAEKIKKKTLGPTVGADPLPLFVATRALLSSPVACIEDDGISDGDGSNNVPVYAGLVNKWLMSLSVSFQKEDCNNAFSFPPDLRFLANCIRNTKECFYKQGCKSKAEVKIFDYLEA